MRDKLLQWRKTILQQLGGLPSPEIHNSEWLYLLKDETRNSIMVDWHVPGTNSLILRLNPRQFM